MKIICLGDNISLMDKTLANMTYNQYILLGDILKNPGKTNASYFTSEPVVDGYIKKLVEFEYVTFSKEEGLRITELGRAAYKEFSLNLEKEKKREKIERFRFWFPVIISILSLALSIIALFK